jgi:DNA-binding FadR family transcriptional regulator
METLPARRVLKAYEQVYEQLRELILGGRLARGQRLPTEVALAGQFGVSRGTIREALRLLVADGLVRTAKGTGGGSYVTLPTVDHVSEFLERNLELLSLADDVTLAEFIQARELLEVFAVRAAAARRTDADLDRLRATFAADDEPLSAYERYLRNKKFHAVLLDIAGNRLLKIAAQPIFFVLHTHLARFRLDASFPQTVCSAHQGIYAHIETGDADAAEASMRRHLECLAGVYRRIWRADPTGERL